MTAASAKDYLAKREIPQLFESLMTGLMYYRPSDHIEYLQNCLRKVKEEGVEQVKWNIFIESRKKTPLPPITPENGKRPGGAPRDPSFITEPQSMENKRGSPLPPIGTTQESAGGPDRIKLPECPIALVMGGPGSGRATQCKKLLERYPGWVHISMGDLLRSEILNKGSVDAKWGAVSQLVSQGELAPEEMTMDMVKDAILKNQNAKGIIIEGFPRTMEQVGDFEKFIGRCDLCFVLDCEEELMQQRLLRRGHATGRVDDNINAVASRIAFFKEKTLPAIKHFDDKGKVIIVDGDRDVDEIFYDLATLFDNVFFTEKITKETAQVTGPNSVPRPPSGSKPRSRPTSTRYSRAGSRAGRPGSGFGNVPVNINIDVPDSGRCVDMPQCPIILVMGAPGSGREEQCKKIAASHSDCCHVSINSQTTNINEVKKALQSADAAKAILLEGFPRSKAQVEQFNQHIGGVSKAVLIDCEESTLKQKCSDEVQIRDFKHNCLPILGYFDDQGKLECIGGINLVILIDCEQSSLWTYFEEKVKVFGESEEVGDILDLAGSALGRFKENTLPILNYIDSQGKLIVINGDRSESEVAKDVQSVVEQFLSSQSDNSANMRVVPPISPDVTDTGRQSGLPAAPIVAVVGSPGCDVGDHAKKLADKCSFTHIALTGKSTSDLLSGLKSGGEAKGFVVSGYPCSKQQVEEFNKQVGGLTYVIVLDTDEATAKKSADQGMVESYKQNTLPVFGHYDDRMKVGLIDVASSKDVLADMCKEVEKAQSQPTHATAPSSTPAAFPSIARLHVQVADSGRKEGLAKYKIITVLGAPGSGYEAHVTKAAEKLSAKVVSGKTPEERLESLSSAKDGETLLLPGVPYCVEELEHFNNYVGGMCGVVVVDTSESFNKSHGATDDALAKYKSQTLPVLAHYDDLGKLEMVEGENESKACDDLCNAISKLTSM